MWDYDLITGEMVYDDRAKEIYGLPLDRPVTFDMVRDATPPEDLERTLAQLERAIDPKIRDRSSYEYRIVRPDGSICWALAHGEAVFEGEGDAARAVRYAGTIQDITERKAAEAAPGNPDRRAQPPGEEHAGDRPGDRAPDLQEWLCRCGGELLRAPVGPGCGALEPDPSALGIAELGEIASAVLQPHHQRGEEQIRLSGEDVRVPPQMAANLAMALHELATNAAKYGALSRPDGRVDLSWSVTHSEPVLHIRWRESGGPEVRQPEREGFGTG